MDLLLLLLFLLFFDGSPLAQAKITAKIMIPTVFWGREEGGGGRGKSSRKVIPYHHQYLISPSDWFREFYFCRKQYK